MSGYCSIGSDTIAPSPPSMMMIASTQAKIGRSMKIRDMGLAARRSARTPRPGRRRLGGSDPLRGRGRDRPDGGSGLEVAGALGDHLVAAAQPARDHPIGSVG